MVQVLDCTSFEVELDTTYIPKGMYPTVEASMIASVLRLNYMDEIIGINLNHIDEFIDAQQTISVENMSKAFGYDIPCERRLSKVKGLHQNPDIIGTLAEQQVEALNIDYDKNAVKINPMGLALALITEGINVFRDHVGGVDGDTAKRIASNNPNEYITQEYAQEYGFSDTAYNDLINIFFELSAIVGDASEPVVKIKEDGIVDSKKSSGGAAGYYMQLGDAVRKANFEDKEQDISERGKVYCLLHGLFTSTLEDTDITPGELKQIMLSTINENGRRFNDEVNDG